MCVCVHLCDNVKYILYRKNMIFDLIRTNSVS
jgi:hypothetical protein